MDNETKNRMRPPQINWGIWCYLISLVVGPIGTAYDPALDMTTIDWLIILVSNFIYCLIIFPILKGKNWARTIYGALIIVGFGQFVLVIPETMNRSIVSGLVEVVGAILQSAFFYFMITEPGASWFKMREKKSSNNSCTASFSDGPRF